MTKIAPTLERLLGPGVLMSEWTPERKAAERELRALLAVARAVGMAKDRAWHRNWQPYVERAFRAHDRLRSVSAGKRGRK